MHCITESQSQQSRQVELVVISLFNVTLVSSACIELHWNWEALYLFFRSSNENEHLRLVLFGLVCFGFVGLLFFRVPLWGVWRTWLSLDAVMLLLRRLCTHGHQRKCTHTDASQTRTNKHLSRIHTQPVHSIRNSPCKRRSNAGGYQRASLYSNGYKNRLCNSHFSKKIKNWFQENVVFFTTVIVYNSDSNISLNT